MKKLFTVALSVAIGATALTSCSKKSDSSPSYSMKATVGSTSFSANYAYATVAASSLGISGFNGSGTTSTAPYISMVIVSWNGSTGTTNFDSTGTTASLTWAPDATMTNWKVAKSGSITISSVSSTVISGTFSGTTTDGTQITSGAFTAKRF